MIDIANEEIGAINSCYAVGYSKIYTMKTYTAIVEKCPQTGLFVGHVPGFVGAHSQGETLDELHHNLQEVIGMLLEDGEPQIESEFVGTQMVAVA